MLALLGTLAAIALLGLKIWHRRTSTTPRQRLLEAVEKRQRERNIVREKAKTRLSYIDHKLLDRVELLLREKRSKTPPK